MNDNNHLRLSTDKKEKPNEIIEDNFDENNFLIKLLDLDSKFFNRRTKCSSINYYESIVKLFNKMNDEELKQFLNYLNKVNIPLLKILVNGFIDFDFNDEKKDIILKLISKFINICFNKNIFYFIYKKLSKHFRRHDKLKDIKSVQKFEKLFKIWKLLYNLDNISSCKQSYTSSIIFYHNISTVIKITKEDNEASHSIITINFIPSPILNINKIVENFFFLKVVDNNKNNFTFKYNNVFIEDNNNKINSFSQVHKIQFDLLFKKYDISINDNIKISNEANFEFGLISEIHLLNNFYGEVSSINIINSYKKVMGGNRKKYDLKIDIYNKNFNYDKLNVDINLIMNDKIKNDELKEDTVKLMGKIFNNESFYLNNFNAWKRGIKDINHIEYFGGYDSFIPLFKIIKYKINDLGNIFKENEGNQKEKLELGNNLTIMVIDILKIIVKLTCLNLNNYKALERTIIPLIGSLAEIIHALNDLSNLELKSILLKDEIIFILYMIINNSKISKSTAEIYEKIFDLENNTNQYNFSFDFIIFDIEKTNINIKWYFISLLNFIISLLISFDSKEKIPINLIKQLKLIDDKNLCEDENSNKNKHKSLLKPFISLIEYLCLGKEENIINIFKNYNNKFGNDIFYLNIITQLIDTIINMNIARGRSNLIPFKNNNLNQIKNIFVNIFNNIPSNLLKKIFEKIINNSNLRDDYSRFKEIIPNIKENEFNNKSRILIDEIIDYHGHYHKLIKEQFIFNRLWSNQKLFYNDTLDKKKKSNLKYKNINYYTRNFQRPIIYPQLDYKYRYPSFSKFQIENGIFREENKEDDYNFNLDSPELDIFVKEYNKKIFELISYAGDSGDIKLYNACRIKQEYHIQGVLFIYYKEKETKKENKEIENIIIYFYSSLSNENEKVSKCNKKDEKDNLCYGSLFKCHPKETNRILKIEVKNIRMIIKRIYYYRNSGIEIFTPSKSYYFNFYSEEDLNNFFYFFESCFSSDFSYEPIKINDNLIGFINIKNKKLKLNNIEKSNKNFAEFISYRMSRGEICKMSVFDIIMIINLISNRSYIDLYQYPVFPILYFYDSNKQNKIERDLKEHIGFQDRSENSKSRKKEFILLFKSTKEDLESEDADDDDEELKGNIYYFNTYYSNIVYTSNFMIRLFPFSFISIELQGDGFDNPNRLFFSIKDTFFNISSQKSDLRELIPEFFYLPEMFININCVNFGNRVIGGKINKVDDVNVPDDNEENTINEIESKDEFINNFTFVKTMKIKLENIGNDLGNWVKLIFGSKQRYLLKPKEGKINKQYFKSESYIDIDEVTYNKYSNDNLIMSSFEFGVIPLQTIFDENVLDNLYIKKYYDKLKSISNKESNRKRIKQDTVDNMENLIKRKKKHEFLDLNYKLELKIENNDNVSKLNIFWNDEKINEIIDHNDRILDCFYNPRLNMYATTAKDGLVCSYIIPYKLFSVIKHPDNLYFNKVFLSANPFPTIITYEEKNKILRAYSLSGILIKEKTIDISGKIYINYAFDIYGGCYNDGLLIYDESYKYSGAYYCPFFTDITKIN